MQISDFSLTPLYLRLFWLLRCVDITNVERIVTLEYYEYTHIYIWCIHIYLIIILAIFKSPLLFYTPTACYLWSRSKTDDIEKYNVYVLINVLCFIINYYCFPFTLQITNVIKYVDFKHFFLSNVLRSFDLSWSGRV